MNEYLEFVDVSDLYSNRKTRVVEVRSTRSHDLLGTIKWFGRWRQYAFFPWYETVWNPDCLDAVNEKIRALMAERKVKS